MIVSNTTPLSSLLRIDRQGLLSALYGKIVIPQAVADELDRGEFRVGRWRDKVSGFVDILKPDANPMLALLAREVDLGEAEAIALATQQNAKLLIIDDYAGRKAAQQLNLSITGTVGVIMAASDAGLVSRPFHLIEELRTQGGLWLSDGFIERLRNTFSNLE